MKHLVHDSLGAI